VKRVPARRWNPARWCALASALATFGAAIAQTAPALRSGFDDMGQDTRAMQSDDTSNPGMLWVADGEALWSAVPASGGRSCADCHGAAGGSMKGVAARYPAFDTTTNGPIDLQGRIAACRADRQGVPVARDSRDLLALSTYVGHQSRGLPMAPPDDPRLGPARQAGRELFNRRQGQLDLSCADCHDANAGKRLAGNVIPQGHPNGYPLYRLEWQAVGSLQRRLRNCMAGVRAEPYALGSPDSIALEVYLAERARGLIVETPAVRP
jgi:sulfur-oxidizing protein SoxA